MIAICIISFMMKIKNVALIILDEKKNQIWGPSSISKYDAILFDIFMNYLESTDSNRFGQYSMNIFISFLSDILVVIGFAPGLEFYIIQIQLKKALIKVGPTEAANKRCSVYTKIWCQIRSNKEKISKIPERKGHKADIYWT